VNLTKEDLRAAVGTGTITEGQARGLIALAKARSVVRDSVMKGDEPFEIFRGFNEIFVTVGLAIFFVGYSIFLDYNFFPENLLITQDGGTRAGAVHTLVLSVVAIGIICLITLYLTLRRMMVAPSILLASATAYFAAWAGAALAVLMINEVWVIPLLALVVLAAYWTWARIPYTLLLVSLATLALIVAILWPEGTAPDFDDFFLLSADGPFAIVTLILGGAFFGVAMWFDQSDPHRITRRTSHAFWLHVAAAPMIVNPVAATLFAMNTNGAEAILVLFVIALAIIALVIDRRSFLLSGIGYIIALIVTVLDNSRAEALLGLGVILVTLGTMWENIRTAIMRRLPDFPGKSNLPPWA